MNATAIELRVTMIQFNKEQKLNEIIADFCDAQAIGLAPSREDLIQNHPEFKSELTQFLNNFDLFFPFDVKPTPVNHFEIQNIDASITKVFDKYELIEEIGRGGIGSVYKALDTKLNRTVALKIIHKSQLKEEKQIKRFQQEVEFAAKLDHPSIVKIFDFGYHEDHGFIAMQFIDGEDLSSKLKRESLFPHEAAKLVKKIAQAAGALHQIGILHRDIKPGNILITQDGDPLLTDFGLVLDTKEDHSLTQSGEILGTPRYMPPEQAIGRNKKSYKLSPASDVYSLGVILYQCITGKVPFDADNVSELLNKITHEDPQLPSSIKRNIPPDLEAICLKCLQKEAKRRYASANKLEKDLAQFLEDKPTEARPLNWLQLVVRKISNRKKRRAIIGGTIAFLILCPLLLLITSYLLSLIHLTQLSKFENFVLNIQSLSTKEPGPTVVKYIEDQKPDINIDKFKSSIVLNHFNSTFKNRSGNLDQSHIQYPQVLKTSSSSIPVSKDEKSYLSFSDQSYSLSSYPDQNLVWEKNFKKYAHGGNPHYYYVAGFDWNPDSSILYIATTNSHQRENYLYKIIVNSGERIAQHSFSNPKKRIDQVEVSPDGKYVYVGFRWKNKPGDDSENLKAGFKVLSTGVLKTVIDWQDLKTCHLPGTPVVFDRFKNEVLINDNPNSKNAKYRVLRRWSLVERKELTPYYIELSNVSNLHLNHSGEYLSVSLRKEQKINFYDLKSKGEILHLIKTLDFHSSGILDPWNRPTESAHPTQIACSMYDGWIQILDSENGNLFQELYISNEDFGRKEFGYSDLLVGNNSLWIQFNNFTLRYPKNVGTKLISHDLGSVAWNLAYDKESKTIMTGNEVGELKAWNLQDDLNGLLSLTLKGTAKINNQEDTNENAFYAISPSGSYLFLSPKPSEAYIERIHISTLERTVLCQLSLKGIIKRAFCSPDEKRLAVVNFDNENGNESATNLVHLYDLQGSEIPKILEPIEILSPKSLDSDYEINHDLHIRDLTFSPDSKLLALAPRNKGENGNKILIYDWDSRSIIKQLKHSNSKCTAIAFSKNGEYLTVAQLGIDLSKDLTRGSLVETWETKSWSKIDSFEPGLIRINCLKYSPDNSRIVTADIDGNIEAWLAPHYYVPDTNTQRRSLYNFGPIKGEACWLQFTDNGKALMVVGGEPGSETPFPVGVLAVYYVGEQKLKHSD